MAAVPMFKSFRDAESERVSKAQDFRKDPKSSSF